MKKKIAVLLTAAMTMSMATGAFAEEAEKVLTIGWPYESSTLDPARASDDASYRVVRLVTDSLLRNVNNEAVPGAAESYETNEDNTEYIFHLREDNMFSDGTPITANDFAYSYERLLNPENANENATAGYAIKNGLAYNMGECDASELGIEVVDDYTLKLTLEYPTYPLDFTVWSFAPVSQEMSDEMGVAYGAEAENILGNGPFVLTEWVHDSEMILEKNENYWDADSINLDKIVIKINAKGDTAVDMLLAGELEVADMDTMMQVNTLTDSGFSYAINNAGVECLHINHAGLTEDAGLFLSNTNFRKALNYAIDRNALVAAAYTTDVPATRLVGVSEAGVESTFQEEYPYEGWTAAADAEKAQECLNLALEELGKTVEDIPTFSMLCYDSENNMIALNAIMDMWDKTLGVKCEIDAQPIQNMLQKMYTGEYDFWKGAITVSGADSLGYADYYVTDGGLFNYNNAEFDELQNTAKYATTWEARKDAIFAMEQYMCDDVVDLYLTWPQTYYVYDSSLTNVCVDINAIDITYADIAE